MKYFFTLSFSLILAYFSKAQNPYPIVPIDSIQFVSPIKLTSTPAVDLPDYISPVMVNSTFGDTVRFDGIVVTNPMIYGVTQGRKAAYIQRLGGGPWSGVLAMCDPATVPGNRPTIANFITETKFYENMEKGYKVRITGKFAAFQGETQINLLRNNLNFSNAIERVDSYNYDPVYTVITIDSLMTGSPTSGNWTQNKFQGEKWEGVLVEIRNLRVSSRSAFGATRWSWSLQDTLGNQIDVRDFSAYYRNDDNEAIIPPISNNYTPPPVGSTLGYIRGIITEYSVGGILRYGIAPIMPGDVYVCESPCTGLVINTPKCAFFNDQIVFNISQYRNFLSDTGIFEFSNDSTFNNIIRYDTLSTFNSNFNFYSNNQNLSAGTYFGRLRLKNQSVMSNTVSFNISLNVIFENDTIISFNNDSILLDAGQGFSSYLWNTGDTNQVISAKFSGKYSVVVKNNYGCSILDSARVVLVDGIQQKDTIICAGLPLLTLTTQSHTFTHNGLVGWWPFNGNANDESGNGNNGIISGATTTTDRFNKQNSAYRFDGIDDFISIVTPTLSSQITISLWAKDSGIYSTSNSVNPRYISSEYCNGGFALLKNIGNTPTGLFFTRNRGNSSADMFSQYNTVFNEWQHIGLTYDGTICKFYVNGLLVSTLNNVGTLESSANILFGRSGCVFSQINDAFYGKLDDIGIWNRALNQQEIQSLFQSENMGVKKKWSTNDTTPSITVFPAKDTTFYCTFTVGSYTFTDSVKVYVKGLPDKQVNFPKLGLCDKDTIDLTAANGYNYQWYKESQMISNNRIIHVSEPGRYVVVLNDSIGCGNMSDAINIFKAPTLKTNFTVNDSAQCIQNNVFVFSDSTNLDSGNYNLSWLFEQNSTSNAFNPSYTYKSVGNKLVKLVGISNYGCKDSTVKMLTVNPNPNVGFMLGDSVGLETSKPYVYSVAQQLNHSYNWDVTNGIIVNGQGSNAATIQWFNNGKGKIKLNLTNPFGCSDSALKEVSIGSVGISDFNVSNSFSILPNPNNGTFNISLNSFSNETINVNILNPIGQIVWTGKYNISNGDNIFTIRTSLPKGVYNLVVEGKDNKSTHKITIW